MLGIDAGSADLAHPRLPARRAHGLWRRGSLFDRQEPSMIEAAMIRNEPSNKSHRDLENDPG
jgi:hypothetical protein